ncbi:MAG: transposase [Niveispirillum sp.]|jgi:putative transposase|uniref:transposase n=1 Tax=Niveispirillum sp. TaxID=1917217 RepID=UPI004036A12B
MNKRRYTAEEVEQKLALADALLNEGYKIVDIARELGVTRVTYYRWRQDQAGEKPAMVRRLEQLERENAELRRRLADLLRAGYRSDTAVAA